MQRSRIIALVSLAIVVIAAVLVVWLKPVRSDVPSSALLRQGTPTEVRDQIVASHAKVTVVNFWASWCEPCKHEFPHYLQLAKTYADRGVRVLFVSVDDRSDFAEAESFLRENGVDFPTFYKGAQSLNFVAEIFPKWTGAVPATVLFGPQAEILDAWEGDTSWTTLEKKVLNALGPR